MPAFVRFHLLVGPLRLDLGVEEEREHHHHRGDQQHHARDAEVLEVDEQPHAQLHAEHGAGHHGEGQGPVDVAELPVADGRDHPLAGDVGHVDARGHVAREAEHDQRRGDHVAAADADEAADDADGEPDQEEQEDGSLHARDGEVEHGSLLSAQVADLLELDAEHVGEPLGHEAEREAEADHHGTFHAPAQG